MPNREDLLNDGSRRGDLWVSVEAMGRPSPIEGKTLTPFITQGRVLSRLQATEEPWEFCVERFCRAQNFFRPGVLSFWKALFFSSGLFLKKSCFSKRLLPVKMRFRMRNQNFKVGDTVELISGGPLMTINRIGAGGQGVNQIECKWFVGSTAHVDYYSPEALKMIESVASSTGGEPLRVGRD